jgi:hypothetical protein
MARQRPKLPRSLPDRLTREALLDPRNLRAVVRELVPDVADQLDYDHPELLPPPYPLDDWRHRDSDFLVRLRFRDGSREILVCILVEHQSSEDPVMPLRLLVYAVLYWEREWKAWEEKHERGVPLRLTPVVPLVLHTGTQRWETNRSLADLFDAPEELRHLQPRWPMPLWDLPEHSVKELLGREEPFWRVLAVARARAEAPAEFLAVLREALQGLEPVAAGQQVYWHELVRFALGWAFARRPPSEHAELIRVAKESHRNVQFQQEITTMSQQLEKAWEDEINDRWQARLEQAERLAEQRLQQAEQRAHTAARRATLSRLLQKRFGPLPEELVRRIETADLAHLEAALDQFVDLTALEQLKL